MLRDRIIRAVKGETFYAPLITTAIPKEPDTVHTRLHQCIRQGETANSNFTPSPSSNVYLASQDDDETGEKMKLHYSNSGSPFFERIIMRGSSSFSKADYKGNRQS